MGIFNDGMYTEEEVNRIKEIYLDIGWLLRDFEGTPIYLQKKWSHEYIKDCWSAYNLNEISRILTEKLQQYGYNYICKYKQESIFDVIYVEEVKENERI